MKAVRILTSTGEYRLIVVSDQMYIEFPDMRKGLVISIEQLNIGKRFDFFYKSITVRGCLESYVSYCTTSDVLDIKENN